MESNNKNLEITGMSKKRAKPPMVRQTLTSMYRIANANPLLLLKDDKSQNSDNFGLNNIKLPKSFPFTYAIQNRDNDIPFKIPNSKKYLLSPTSSRKIPNHQASSQKNFAKYKPNTTKVKQLDINEIKHLSQQSETLHGKDNANIKQMKKVVLAPKRKSLSAEHFERKKEANKLLAVPLTDQKQITKSLQEFKKQLPSNNHNVSSVRKVTFKTPTVSDRYSIGKFTPTPYKKQRPSLSTTMYLNSDHIRHLKEWLLTHKRTSNHFNHLKCFGLNSHFVKEEDEENKENLEVIDNSSYEDLNIIPDNTDSTLINNHQNDSQDIRKLTQNALSDLHQLILEGYSLEQSEAWLGMIRQKYNYLEDEPQYWECRAAIEQSRGNITSAVHFLRTAIVQGAEVDKIDNSLEQLLHTFSLLNINTGNSVTDEDQVKKDRARIILDARNVFKSSIIQFAIQERTFKKNVEDNVEKKFVATPVRRSTRITQSKYRCTPKIRLCTSLKDLDNSFKENIDFQSNNALTARFFK